MSWKGTVPKDLKAVDLMWEDTKILSAVYS
jgi:hypothetical protein